MTTLDYTVILNAHKEGVYAHRAVRSIAAMARFADEADYTGEVLLVADRSDKATKDIAGNAAELEGLEHFERIDVDEGDLGMARNIGVGAAKGRYVFFLDADDVWGAEWLTAALDEFYKYAGLGCGEVILHPQCVVNFGADKMYWQHKDVRDPNFDPSVFMLTNHWTANCAAPRRLLQDFPYERASKESGFGFEDWEWNSRTWSQGIPHLVVPETVHFIRKRIDSMSREHAAQARVIKPGGVFTALAQKFDYPKLPPMPALAIGEWLDLAARQVHTVEPDVWADARDYIARQWYTPPAAPAMWKHYWEMREGTAAYGPTHMLLGAGLGGGADARVEFYAKQIKAAGHKPMILWTQGRGRAVPGVPSLDLSREKSRLGEVQAVIVLQRYLLELPEGTVLHFINSELGFMALSFGVGQRAFAARKLRIFASFYAIEKNRDGQLGGYAVNGGLNAVAPVLEQAIVDSQPMIAELRQATGWPESKTAYVPSVAVPFKRDLDPEARGGKPNLRWLWAGRLEWAKNPALLAKIAEAMPNVMFTVIGAPGDEFGRIAAKRLAGMRNVVLLPAYTGQLPMEMADAHDALIITSTHEGMPHLVLEALALGLPVISTHVGAMRGLARSTFVETVPVQDQADSMAWYAAFNRLEARHRAERRGHEYLESEHSPEAARAALKAINYL